MICSTSSPKNETRYAVSEFAGCTSTTSPLTRKRPRPSTVSLRTYWLSISLRSTRSRSCSSPTSRIEHPLAPLLRRAEPVDARDGRDDDTSRRVNSATWREPQPRDVVVLRRVLLDVEVGLRDVRLGLVVVVVGDEVLDGVRREELAELVAELRGERLVVRDHERRPLHLLDDPGHRRRLAGAGRAEQRLVALAVSSRRRARRSRAAGRRSAVGVRCFELRHPEPRVSPVVRRPTPPCRTRLLRRDHGRVRGHLRAAGGSARTLDRDPACQTTLDLVVLSAASFKAARTLASDEVTSFIREPFVKGEAHEGRTRSPVEGGMEQAIGELVTCTRCVGTWAAAGLVVPDPRSAYRAAAEVVAGRRRRERLPAGGVRRPDGQVERDRAARRLTDDSAGVLRRSGRPVPPSRRWAIAISSPVPPQTSQRYARTVPSLAPGDDGAGVRTQGCAGQRAVMRRKTEAAAPRNAFQTPAAPGPAPQSSGRPD